MVSEDLEKKVIPNSDKRELPEFDPDLSPNNVYNRKVAGQRGLTYDKRNKVYRDSDGCPTRDRYGQPLG